MSKKNSLFLGLVMILTLGAASVAMAFAPAVLLVDWRQDSINWEQLQSVFREHPDYTRFNIHFPNGASWTADKAELQVDYAVYLEKARSLGYDVHNSNLPALSFSSLEPGGLNTGGAATVSVRKATQNMQAAMQNAVDEADNQKASLASHLPAWLRNFVDIIYNGVINFYHYIVDHIRRWV